MLALLLAFSSWYQASFRPQLDERSRTEIFLTDYTRLDVMRLALASQTGLEDVPNLSGSLARAWCFTSRLSFRRLATSSACPMQSA